MTFHVALAAAVLLTASGAAHAQTSRSETLVDRVVVDIDGKPMPAIRAELARAAEAVCRTDPRFMNGRDEVCVSATYNAALHRAKLARTARSAPALTQVASR